MNNPFETIEVRLSSIENLLLELRQKPWDLEAPTVSEKFLTVQEAAKFLRLKVPTIYSKVSKGELPVLKRGNRLYFSDNELKQYLKEGTRLSNNAINRIASNHLASKNRRK